MLNLRIATLTSVALLSTLHLHLANATENGATEHPVGVNTSLNGLVPDPGQTYMFNYTLFYRAEHFNDANGKSAVPKFHVEMVVDAPRVLHTWEATLGPFTLTSGAIFPIFHQQLAIAGRQQTKNALGDIILHPLYLGYVNQAHNFFTVVAPFDISLPTGDYDKNRIANPGQNHVTFLPNILSTWFPAPRVEVSTAFTAEFFTKNHATDYQSGTVLSTEAMVGYSLTPTWQVAIQGYYSKQVSDDKWQGETYQNGFRGQVAALGPQIRYNFTPRSAMVLKYQHEFAAENRSEGDKVMLQFAFPI
ncbi:transporter [Pseudomonas yamanorum]|uniref:SphA family protein n=1 Tax=Pseudomonas yamanorum TaxID=515393 RepID=UPI001C461A67|nr:transporter [Pseudomonas yamanorum]MBV6659717.1 transporter [Pseudomonas yamanorum]